MGVLLVAGFAVLVFGFIQLANSPSSDIPPIMELPLDRLGVPAGAQVISVAEIADRLVLLLQTADGEQSLLMVDAELLFEAAGEGQ